MTDKLLYANVLGKGNHHLVVLHGFLGMSDNWKTHGRRWAAQGWKVHLLDLRNHGRSFWSPIFDYATMAEDLQAYCSANGLEKITLLGHSMGGKVAMLFACRYPHQVEKLIVADIAPKSYPPHHQAILHALSTLDFSQIDSRAAAEAHLKQAISDSATRQFLLKNIHRKTPQQLGLRINIAVLKNAGEAIGEALPAGHRFEGPTLFMRGERSTYIDPATDAAEINRFFPSAELVTVPAAGHWLHAENPTAFLTALEQWWAA